MTRKYASLVLISLFSSVSLAVISSAKAEPAPEKNATVESIVPTIALSPVVGGIAPSNSVSINATSTNSVASISVSPKPTTEIASDRATFIKQSWALSSPVSKSSSLTNLVSLDGLANASSITYSFYEFITGWKDDIQARQNRDRICSLLKQKADQPSSDIPKDALCSTYYIDKYLHDQLRDWNANRVGPTGGGIIFGTSLKLGSQTYSYIDKSNLTSTSVTKTPWAASVYVARQPSSYENMLLLAKYEFQRSYVDASSGTICPVVPGASQLTCASGALGAPTANVARIVTLEFRDALFLKSAAFSVSYHHDFQAGANSIELPIYLVNDAPKGLTGGLLTGWRSKPDSVVFGVFVSSPFL